MFEINETKARAMGNAFKMSSTCDGLTDCVLLCNMGIMGVYKALKEKCIDYTFITPINNVTADSYQYAGIPFFEIVKAD